MDYEQHENYEYFVITTMIYRSIQNIQESLIRCIKLTLGKRFPEIRLQHLGFHRISLDVFPSASSNDVDFTSILILKQPVLKAVPLISW